MTGQHRGLRPISLDIWRVAMCFRVCQLKNFKNQSMFGKEMDKSLVAHFYGPQCSICKVLLLTISLRTETSNERLDKM